MVDYYDLLTDKQFNFLSSFWKFKMKFLLILKEIKLKIVKKKEY